MWFRGVVLGLLLVALPASRGLRLISCTRFHSAGASTRRWASVLETALEVFDAPAVDAGEVSLSDRLLMVSQIHPLLLESGLPLKDLLEISEDLLLWRTALQRGLLPEKAEIWPRTPLLIELMQILLKLKVPQLLFKHKELVQPMLNSIVELGLRYSSKVDEQRGQQEDELREQQEERRRDEWYLELLSEEVEREGHSVSPEVCVDIATSLLRGFETKWSPPLAGVACLDSVLGLQSGILSELDEDNMGGGGGGGGGLGLFDGVWQHTGVQISSSFLANVNS
jgi:hypothetical protein